jgi:predicted nucleotidyltransferase
VNEESRQRIYWAEALAQVYASQPDVLAIILGGSSARAVAQAGSDIDLGLFWKQIPSPKESIQLIDRIGGRLTRRVDNQQRYSMGNPRRQGCIEIVDIWPSADQPCIGLDIEHETVAGTEKVLSEVVDQYDPSIEKQELLSVIEHGIVLHGHDLVNHWKEKAKCYPDEIVEKMVSQYLMGIGSKLLNQAHWIRSQDWFMLYEGFLDIGRRLLLTIMGLNRVWVFTDNQNFKGWKYFTDRFAWQPDHFVDRIGNLLQSDVSVSIQGFADLIEEVLAYVDIRLASMDTSEEWEMLKQVRHRLTHS